MQTKTFELLSNNFPVVLIAHANTTFPSNHLSYYDRCNYSIKNNFLEPAVPRKVGGIDISIIHFIYNDMVIKADPTIKDLRITNIVFLQNLMSVLCILPYFGLKLFWYTYRATVYYFIIENMCDTAFWDLKTKQRNQRRG